MAVHSVVKRIKLVIDDTDEFPSMTDTHLLDLAKYCDTLYELVDGLLTFRSFKTGPNNYNYKFTMSDGRVWDQDINTTAPNDIKIQNNNLSGLWKLSEIDLIRNVRDRCVSLFGLSATLIEIKIVYDLEN